MHVADASRRQLAELSLDRSPSGSDAARVRYDAGEIEGASCARRVPSRVYIEKFSMLHRRIRATSTAVGAVAAATMLGIGTNPELLFRGSSVMKGGSHAWLCIAMRGERNGCRDVDGN